MRFLSVCSGIEAASVAWKPLGWEAVAFSEIAPFPCAVLAHHYPNVPNLGDLNEYRSWDVGPVQLVVGGTPCQSFSVAGLRKGLADPRGNLALVFLGLVDQLRPKWVVWENVPGVLSSGDGRDFGSFLGGLGQLGYGWAYRVLDAQYIRVESHPFAVPQRRRRVFVVGCLGSWASAAAVLLERESMSWHPAPRREAGQRAAPTITSRPSGGGGLGTDFDCDGGLIPAIAGALGTEVPGSRQRADASDNLLTVAHSLRADGHDASEDGTGRGVPLVAAAYGGGNTAGPIDVATACTTKQQRQDFDTETLTTQAMTVAIDTVIGFAHQAGGNGTSSGAFSDGLSPTLGTSQTMAIAFQERGRIGGRSCEAQEEVAYSLNAPSGGGRRQEMTIASPQIGVRRLTPLECERLQGFPDGYTLVPYRGKKPADGPRYKAIGNSIAVNCLRWIGERLRMAHELGR